MLRAFIRFCRVLPARLDLEHLRWARREIRPDHPDLPDLVLRIAELEEMCRA